MPASSQPAPAGLASVLGVHSLVWTGRFDADGARRSIVQAREAGYDLIEISLHEPALLDVETTRAALAENDMQITVSRGLSFEHDPSSEDPEVSGRGEAVLLETLDLTARLGGRYFGGALYGALGKYGLPPTAQGRQNAVDVLRRLATRAGKLGIVIGLEIVNRYESNLVNTAAECLALIEDIGADNIVVHLDTYHMNIEEQDFVRPVHLCGSRLGYVHIGESHRGYLGSGTVDFRSFFHALADVGYRGTIAFESFPLRW